MRSRSTLLLVALAALAAAYFYWYELPRGEAKKQEEARSKKLFDGLVADEVTAVEVPTKDGGRARVVRVTEGGAKWKLEEPLVYPADDAAVDSLLTSLAGLSLESEVKEIPGDLAPFGLGEGARTLRAIRREGEPWVLLLGGKAPLGTTRYVLRDGAARRLATVSDLALSSLEPELLTLRDKRIARLEPDDVDALRVVEKGKPLVAAKRGAGDPEHAEWTLSEPVAEAGDGARIRRLVQDVSFLRATGFADGAVDEKATGLGAPELEIELSAGERTERVELARAAGKVYARASGAENVAFEVPDRILGDVPRDVFAYRWKRVFALGDAKVARLELYFPRDNAQYAFAKEGDTWKASGSDVEPESLRIEDVVYALHQIDAVAAIEGSPPLAKLGLEPPHVRIEPEDAEGKSLGWLELGDTTGDGIAARASTGERLWRVAKTLGDDLPLGQEAFQNRWLKPKPAPPAPAAAPAPGTPAPAPGAPEAPPAQPPPAAEK